MGELGMHNGWCGDIPSARPPVVLGMASQCPGCRHSRRDGCTGSEATEALRSIHLASRHRPGRVLSWWPYASRGCRCPFSRGVA
jgi:hypothetical protein